MRLLLLSTAIVLSISLGFLIGLTIGASTVEEKNEKLAECIAYKRYHKDRLIQCQSDLEKAIVTSSDCDLHERTTKILKIKNGTMYYPHFELMNLFE